MPVISVIMPAYNASKFIAEAIESILNQTFSDFELIICDDGSTDKTLTVIKKYAETDKRIRVLINKKNIGNLKTTNRLLAECTGEYIAIQDADDISEEQRLQLLWNELNMDKELGIVGCNYVVTDSFLNPLNCGYLPLSDVHIKKAMDREPPPMLYASILVRKSIVDKIGYFRPIFKRRGYADLDWLYRICETTIAKNINYTGYYYRQHKINRLKKKDFFESNGIEILVESHKQRMNGEIDFLKKPDIIRIRKFMSKLYKARAEQFFWNNKTELARENFINSIILYPFDMYVLKSLLKLYIKH